MEAFDYVAPRSLAEAYAHLGNGRTSLLLAGGTDVIVQLREGRKRCDQLIDLKHIPELMRFGFAPDGTLEVGAAAPLAALYEDAEVLRRVPALVDAASIIGGTAIQSRASLGGNLCNASPAADSSAALMVLGARLLIGSASGTRELPVEELFAGPGVNTLQPSELLVQVRIPPQPPRSGAFYLRFIPRNEMDIAVASAGARLELNATGDRIEGARIALGAVGPTPLMAKAAAEALAGEVPGEEAFARAGELAAGVASPITDMRGSVAQRKRLASVLTVRALRGALQRAREAR
ncbi:MAG: xanthine dehydrogenase family protein subunit M [Dehalococcoidia bacterium]|nr:xanthine dehydrogenase family protein subunit M [Dehalococcoidia bacterium]